jgi:hypothetical protein
LSAPHILEVDEAHRMSWSLPARRTRRYALGELLVKHQSAKAAAERAIAAGGSLDHPEHRLLEKLQEIRNALDDDAVFNVVGDLLPAAHVEHVLRDYHAGRLGHADLEERLLRKVDAEHFRAICQNALERLATKTLNLELLIKRRAPAQERWLVPETIARFLQETVSYVPMSLKPVPSLKHTFEPSRTP